VGAAKGEKLRKNHKLQGRQKKSKKRNSVSGAGNGRKGKKKPKDAD